MVRTVGLCLALAAAGATPAGAEARPAAPVPVGRMKAQPTAPAARRPTTKAPQPASEAHRLLRRGQYEAALARATDALRSAGVKKRGRRPTAALIEATLVAARAQIALGRLRAARTRLEEAALAAPDDLPLRALLLQAADAEGDEARAASLQDLFAAVTLDETTPKVRARDLIALAQAARLSNDFKRANRFLRTAVRLDPGSPEANVLWGKLFLEKHAVASAVTSFDAALAIDPHHPDALVGKARTCLLRGYDHHAADLLLDAALTENPHHHDALTMRGEMALDLEDFDAVAALVQRLRDTNPHAPGAAWLAAAAARLRDRDVDYARERDARLATRPADGDFFAHVAGALVRQRRYTDARAVGDECVALAPRHAGCLAALGTTMLRQADEEAGVQMLRRAFAADPYNEHTFNQLELFERTIPEKYTIVTTEHFRFRIQPALRPALEKLIAPFLEKTYAYFAARYRYQPPLPITVELYDDPADYAIRTVGVPALDVAAVCFGRVITAPAPGRQSGNWGMVLAHELGHTFAIGLSRERVPRWFTEGLSETETAHIHPDWTRRDHMAFYRAWQTRPLPPLDRLSQAFLQARNDEQSVTAYMHSAMAVSFLEKRFGFDRLRQALVQFGAGTPATAVLRTLIDGAPMDLDQAFEESLVQRYQPLRDQFLPGLTEHMPLQQAEQRARAPGANATDLARAGLAAFHDNDLAKAHQWLALARKKSTDPPPLVAYLAGVLADRRGDAETVRTMLTPLLEEGLDGYDIRVRLGLAALRTGDLAVAEQHFTKATALAPEEISAWAFLSQVYQRTGQHHKKLDAQITAFHLDPQSARLGKDVVTAAAALAAHDHVATLAPMALFIDPTDPKIHALYGQALQALGRHRDALTPLQHALDFGHPNPHGIHTALAVAFTALGENTRAHFHRTKANKPTDDNENPTTGSPMP